MKIGILGAGKIAGIMAEAIKGTKEGECYAIASRDGERAAEFAEKHGFSRAYGSYEELAADPAVELIYVATPHSHHYEHARLCLLHDKPVLCEKAFTANASQARELIRLAKERKVFITEAIWTRYMPMRRIIQNVVEDGSIGEVTSLSASLGYVIANKERMYKPELAGGALLDLGVYPINFASMVFGTDIEETVSGVVLHETGVDAANSITIRYKGGRMAVLHSSMTALTDRSGVLYGSRGYAVVENINNPEAVRVYDLERKLQAEYKAPAQINGYEYELEAAIKAVSEGRLECSEMPHEETIRVMEFMDGLRAEWGIVYPFEK